MKKVWEFVKRAMRCGHALARNKQLPWWLRLMFVIGCVQIPVLPVDEIFLVLAVGIMAIFHRSTLRASWAAAAR